MSEPPWGFVAVVISNDFDDEHSTFSAGNTVVWRSLPEIL